MGSQSVLISGIGIAGPTLAYWLMAHGFRPTLVERAPRLRSGGYVIDFWGRGYDVAERMGLVPELRRAGVEVDELRFVDAAGRRAGGFPVDVIRELTSGRYVSLRRSDLSQRVFERIARRCEVLFGESVESLEPAGDEMTVGFARGARRRFDLVVGADGLHSAVRRLAFGSQDRFERPLGYSVAAFEVGGYRPRDERVYVAYGLPGRQVARFAMDNDCTLFLFVFASRAAIDPGDAAAQKRLLRREFADAGWECPQILAAMEGCDELYFDRVSQIRMPGWTRGRVALVGDAAFCPSLLAGEGAALAMVASYVLAGELARADGRPGDAFARYESLLRPFLARKQEAAERFASAFAPRTRFGLFVRNRVTAAFRLPGIARLVIGRSLLDRLALPEYPVSNAQDA